MKILVFVSLVVGAAVVATRIPGARARHLAVPVLVDPSGPSAPAPAIEPTRIDCRTQELGRVGRRITALLPAAGGGVWVGTFDDGVVRLGGEAPAAARSLAGRRRMVNALAAEGGSVWAATQGGLIALDGPAAGRVLLGEESVSALARAGGMLLAGTGHGLYRVGPGGAEPVAAAGPDGEELRVTALASRPDGDAGPARLWVGTAAGAYSLEPPDAAGRAAATWRPLVFGAPPAASNVVTALAVLGDAAVAGTDDGGLARIGPRGEVSAVRLADPLSNQVNPGAAAGSGSVLAFGTQGGGLLLVRARGTGLEVQRPSGLESAAVSAASADARGWLLGTSDGRVVRVECPGVLASN